MITEVARRPTVIMHFVNALTCRDAVIMQFVNASAAFTKCMITADVVVARGP